MTLTHSLLPVAAGHHPFGPQPGLLPQGTELRIMSESWAERNKPVERKDTNGSDGNFAHRNAMDTGPYAPKPWQPGVRMAFTRNPPGL